MALQVLQAYMEGERATAAAAATDGPLAAAQDQVAELQVSALADLTRQATAACFMLVFIV